jgi:glyoxylase-like metal-dependent hydrolase (beta-lactamase superfamily II)
MTDYTGTDYTGAVTVGGPIDVRELDAVTIAKLAVGSMNNNAYLIRDRATGDALLIDAAAEPSRLAELASLGGPAATKILTTHRHHDHVGALAALVDRTGAITLAGAEDAAALPVPVTRPLDHGDVIAVGDSTVETVALRGHTPGSVAVLYRDPTGAAHLFTGDSLFPGGVGRTMSPVDFTSLIDDVEQRVFDVLPDDTWIYPGHGDDTTLGAERPHLEEWRARGW